MGGADQGADQGAEERADQAADPGATPGVDRGADGSPLLPSDGAQLQGLAALPEPLAWAVLIGVQDPAVITACLPRCSRLLLVQPNDLLHERLLDFWHGNPPAGVEISAELPAADSSAIPWYTYNDRRLDGITGPDALRPSFPNLVLLDQQFRAGTPLQQLLLDWWQRSGDPGGSGLLLHWGDGFEAALQGAGELIERFQCLQQQALPHHDSSVSSGGAATAPLARWLQSCCFTPLPATAGVVSGWQRQRLRLPQRQGWELQREQMQRAFELVQQRLEALAGVGAPGLLAKEVDALLGSWEEWQG